MKESPTLPHFCECCRTPTTALRVEHFENAPGQAVIVLLCEECFATRNSDHARAREVKFSLGKTVATPGALKALPPEEILTALSRHVRGDWGDCCPEDVAENDFALDKYLRLFSVYHSAAGVKFWVITEADRSVTTVLLPHEY